MKLLTLIGTLAVFAGRPTECDAAIHVMEAQNDHKVYLVVDQGDTITWKDSISFQHNSPCSNVGAGTSTKSCVVNAANDGSLYLYDCKGKIKQCDPGIKVGTNVVLNNPQILDVSVNLLSTQDAGIYCDNKKAAADTITAPPSTGGSTSAVYWLVDGKPQGTTPFTVSNFIKKGKPSNPCSNVSSLDQDHSTCLVSKKAAGEYQYTLTANGTCQYSGSGVLKVQ